MSPPLIIAHRGVTQNCAENTIAAFEQAIAISADMIEFDVRCTQDNILIIHHDPKVAQKTIQQTTWADLQAINANIPTLASALRHCQDRIQLDIEIKEIGYELATIALILNHLPSDAFVITSFHHRSLQTIQRHYPKVKIGWLLHRSMHHLTLHSLQTQITNLKPDFLVPHYSLLNSPWIKILNANHLPYWVWTVNQIKLIQHMLDNPQIGGIITDNCEGAIGLNQQSRLNQ
jgi:glycerophosphoryl diester phosphodiesterase